MKLARKVTSFCCLGGAIITLIFAFFLPIILNDQLNKQIPLKAMMTRENNRTWGEVPGALNVTAVINFTFFNFSNPFEVLYLNHTPEFVETSAYSYQTFSQFLDANFSNETNGETVEFHPYQWYKPYGDVKEQDTVTIPNLGPLIAWYSMKNSPREKICIEAMVNLADGFETSMGPAVTSQAVWTAYVDGNKTTIYDLIFSKAEVALDDYNYIWSDDQYGWEQSNTFLTWIVAAQEGADSVTSRVLMEYFDLTFSQMSMILEGQLQTYMDAMDSNVANMFNCSSVPCDAKTLGYLQWAQQGVTLNLPGPNKTESIFETGNATLSGYPEISYYLKRYFPKTVSNDSVYQNVTFSVPLALRLFNRSNILHHPLQDWNILIHIGNLAWIFSVGEEYKKTGNLSSFQPMVNRFELDSLYQAHVLFAYLDYFTQNFSSLKDQNGSAELLIGGGKIAETVYTGFVDLQEFLPLHLTTLYVKRNATNLKFDCEFILTNSMNIEEYTAAQVCQSLNFSSIENSTVPIKQLVSSCWYQEGDSWDFLLNKTLLTRNNLLTICFDSNSLFNQLLDSAELALYNHYNCTSLGERCNKFQMAVMQWGNSNITNNVPSFLAEDLQNTTSVTDWDKEAFPKPVEFVPVMRFLKKVFNGTDQPGFTYDHSLLLLNFDHIFNSLVIRQTFLNVRNNLLKNITDTFQVEDPWPLIYYMRYMMVELSFGGFTQTRTIKELLWGYYDPILAQVAFADPVMEGGDPSIRSVVNLIPNGTLESARNLSQSFYTGRGDITKVRTYKKINGYDYITSTVQKFNGNESYADTFNPWKKEIPLLGSDGAQTSPQMNPNDKFHLLNPSVYKVLDCEWDRNATFEKSGMNIRRYRINNATFQSKKSNPANDAFYMDRWDGVLNLTATQGAPIYLSKLHYLHADPSLQASVNIYKDLAKTQKITPGEEDDSYFDVEPISGASFGSSLKLQTGYYIQGDGIYAMSFDGLFPVFTIQGGGGITDDMVQTLFGSLKLVLVVKKFSLPVCLAVAALQFILALYLLCRVPKEKVIQIQDGENKLHLGHSESEQATFDKSNSTVPLLANQSNLTITKNTSESLRTEANAQEQA